MLSKKLVAVVLGVLLIFLPSTSFAQSDSEQFSLVAPSEGQSISSTNFLLELEVSPSSHRYKIFIGQRLSYHDIFKQQVATKDFFDSNFQNLRNGNISQRVNLRNIEVSEDSQSIVASVILFFKGRKPAIRHFRFNLQKADNSLGLLQPKVGTQITGQDFELRARVDASSHRYKVFVGGELREHDIFGEEVATKEYFDSNFQPVRNGLIEQRVSLNSSVLRNRDGEIWISVISFFRGESLVVENYKFAIQMDGGSANPVVVPPIVAPPTASPTVTTTSTTTTTTLDVLVQPNPPLNQPVGADLSSLQGRVRSLLNNGYRVGFGENATGGNRRLVTVSNTRGDNSSGSLRQVVSSAQSGDYIVFDRSLSGRTINLDGTINVRQSNITIDGRIQGGGHVTITSRSIPVQLSINASNIIVHFLEFSILDDERPSVMLRTGENIWLDAVTVRNAGDDAIGIGFPPGGGTSASKISITRYHSIGNAKGLLVNTDGFTCRGVNDPSTGRLLNQSYVDQRRAEVTVAYAHLERNNDRNLRNSGGFMHAFNIWADNVSLGMQSAQGSETILESGYYDMPNPHNKNPRLMFTTVNGGASQHTINLGEATHIGGPVTNQTTGIPSCPGVSYLYMHDIEARGQGSSIQGYIAERDDSQLIIGRSNFSQGRTRPFNIPYSYQLTPSQDLPRTLRGNVGVNSRVYE